ncbi:1808_t:CDS:1 [Acaulospora morrowiae]|uniref:1808_t:CDS:1 n=1 Tax=Acaulospora morrowiae TaxID=94023 RepID=A0A9N8ZWB5_9GLOM|nr:1808_t:CDS:1 [Acaulospora morrowiae]
MADIKENPGSTSSLDAPYLLKRWVLIKKELRSFTEPVKEIKYFGSDKRLHYGRKPDSLLFHSVDPSLMHSPRLSKENINKIDQYVMDIIYRLPKNGTFGVYSCHGTYCYRSFNPNEDHHLVITEDPTFNPSDAIIFHWDYSGRILACLRFLFVFIVPGLKYFIRSSRPGVHALFAENISAVYHHNSPNGVSSLWGNGLFCDGVWISESPSIKNIAILLTQYLNYGDVYGMDECNWRYFDIKFTSLSIRDSHYSNNPLEALDWVEKHGKKVSIATLKGSQHRLKLYPINYHLAIASCRNSSPYYLISQFLVQSPPDSRDLKIADPEFSEKWIKNFVKEYQIKYGPLESFKGYLTDISILDLIHSDIAYNNPEELLPISIDKTESFKSEPSSELFKQWDQWLVETHFGRKYRVHSTNVKDLPKLAGNIFPLCSSTNIRIDFSELEKQFPDKVICEDYIETSLRLDHFSLHLKLVDKQIEFIIINTSRIACYTALLDELNHILCFYFVCAGVAINNKCYVNDIKKGSFKSINWKQTWLL